MLSPEFLRIAFLASLVAAGVFFIFSTGLPALSFSFRQLFRLLTGLAFASTVGLFFVILFNIDPLSYARQAGYYVGLQQLISLEQNIPAELATRFDVVAIQRSDTDGDGFNEWVVFYSFGNNATNDAIKAVVYDNDRGDPPVFFPYELRAPGRNYLIRGRAIFDLVQITSDENGPNGEDLEELIVQGGDTLAMFRFRQNSGEWDYPRDIPPRYQSVGFFRGSAGVEFDEDTGQVTVLDAGDQDRSRLGMRSVYGFNEATNSYWENSYGPAELDRALAAPIFTTVDFLGGPPSDILNATFPEQIVMVFYIATCGSRIEGSLCDRFDNNWQVNSFLVDTALAEYNNGNPQYFGLQGFNSTNSLAITDIRFNPRLETDADLDPSGPGRDIITGERAQLSEVEVGLIVNNTPEQRLRFAVRTVDGQWKLVERLPLPETQNLFQPPEATP